MIKGQKNFWPYLDNDVGKTELLTYFSKALYSVICSRDQIVVNYEFTIFDHKREPKIFFIAIFGIFGVKLGGPDMKIGKTSKFIKIDLYMIIPRYEPHCSSTT